MTMLYILIALALLLIDWASFKLWTEPDVDEVRALCGSIGERDGDNFSCPERGITWEE